MQIDPESPFDGILLRFLPDIRDSHTDLNEVDRELPYLMVERDEDGSVVLTSGDSPEDLVRLNHRRDNELERWGLEAIYDARTGAVVHGTVTVEVKY